MKNKMENLIKLVEEWAYNRNLLKKGNAPIQYLKFLEEVGETAAAIIEKDESEIIDGFGDIAVTIIILAKQLNVKLVFRDDAKHYGSDSFWSVASSVTPSDVNSYALEELAICCKQYGFDLEFCLNSAYNTIKARTGKTVGGTFIKD